MPIHARSLTFLVAACVVLLACAGDVHDTTPGPGDEASSPSPPEGRELLRIQAGVLIGTGFRACTQDADCMLVSTSCAGCCEGGAIRTDERAAYEAALVTVCEGHPWDPCRCESIERVPICDEGLCEAPIIITCREEALECAADALCTYAAPDAARCEDYANRIWEGTCGDVRYRIESTGYRGTQWYWDAASGELLARLDGADSPTFCDRTSIDKVQGDVRIVQTCDTIADDTTLACPP